MVRIPILLSAVMFALPALAHDRDDFRLVLPVISGSVAESIELVLRVLRGSGAHAGDGSSCHLSVAVEAVDATGENPTPVTDSAELEPDELFVFDLPLSKLHDAGRIRVAMQITGSGASRACLLEVSGTRRVTITDIKENLSTASESAAMGSPGVLPGNVVQVPINIPVNLCGNTVHVVGLLNPTVGNTCVNGR